MDYECVFEGEQSKLSAHMQEVMAESGKSRSDLTPAMYDALKHSERLFRRSMKRTGGAFIPKSIAQS